jgi:hypothetical protein
MPTNRVWREVVLYWLLVLQLQGPKGSDNVLTCIEGTFINRLGPGRGQIVINGVG